MLHSLALLRYLLWPAAPANVYYVASSGVYVESSLKLQGIICVTHALVEKRRARSTTYKCHYDSPYRERTCSLHLRGVVTRW
jgi:hypothetical protein